MRKGFTLRQTITAATALALVLVLSPPAVAASLTEPIAPQFIIGPDGRYPVDPSAYPATATVLLTFVYYDRDGQWKPNRCTGWVAGHHDRSTTIITAGHCVFFPDTGVWHRNYYVQALYPNAITCPAVALYVPAGWSPGSFAPEYDYGAVKVNCRPSGQPLGQLTSAYGYAVYPVPTGTAVRTQGYPNDRQSGPALQWASDGVVGPSTAQRLFYDNDASAGQNGSPVYVPNMPGCGHCVAAIHGNYPDPSRNLNNGVRITSNVYNDIRYWTNLP
jgi:V8-like Glu-specific endopeptidase